MNVWCIIVLNVVEQIHYIYFLNRSSVTLILIFNFTTHNGKIKETFKLWIISSIFLTAMLNNIRIKKNFIKLCHHQQDSNMDAEWIFFATSYGKSPYDDVGGFVKRYVAKHNQMTLHGQILSYQSILDLCVRETPSITFFDVSREETVNVHNDLEHCFAKSKTMPGTRHSHHFHNWGWRVSSIWFW